MAAQLRGSPVCEAAPGPSEPRRTALPGDTHAPFTPHTGRPRITPPSDSWCTQVLLVPLHCSSHRHGPGLLPRELRATEVGRVARPAGWMFSGAQRVSRQVRGSQSQQPQVRSTEDIPALHGTHQPHAVSHAQGQHHSQSQKQSAEGALVLSQGHTCSACRLPFTPPRVKGPARAGHLSVCIFGRVRANHSWKRERTLKL